MLKMLRRLFKPKPKTQSFGDHVHVGVKAKRVTVPPILTERVELVEVAPRAESSHNTPHAQPCPQGDIDGYHAAGLGPKD